MAKATRKKAGEGPAAALVEGKKETPIPVEEIPAPVQNLPAIITAEEKAKQEVARFDVARNWIAEKKAAYGSLTIANLEDKDGQKAVHAAWQEIRNKRLAVEKTHKALKADYLVITRAIDGEKNDLVKLLEEIEDPLKAELDRIEAEREAIRQKAEREAQEKLQGRVAELLENGMSFNGSYYAIGDAVSMDVVTLKAMSDEDYGRLLDRVKTENQAILDRKAEEERKAQEERDRLEQQRKDQEEKDRQQAERDRELQEERDKLEQQRKDLLAARTKGRAKMLEALGMTYNYSSFVWQFGTFDMGRVTLPVGTVEGLNEEKWETEYDDLAAKIKGMKEGQAQKDKERADQEAAERKRLEDERVAAEAKKALITNRKAEVFAYLGAKEQPDGSFKRVFDFPEIAPLLVTKSQLENYDAEAWEAEMKRLQDDKYSAQQQQERLQKEANEKAEAARQAALSDVERVNEFLRNFGDAIAKRPQITDPKISAAFAAFDRTVAGAVEDLGLILDNVGK